MIVKFTKDGKMGIFIVNNINYDYHNKNLNFGFFHEDYGTSIVIDKSRCEILDNRIPPDWVLEMCEGNSFTIGPKEFTEPIDPNAFDYSKIDFTDPAQKEYWENRGPVFASESTEFWERYHDGCPIAEEIFAKVTKKIKEFHGIEG